MTKRYQQIILHAGLPKTASTSIQNNCFIHREVLLQHGIHYPAFHLGEKRLLNHSDPLSAALYDEPNKDHWAFRQGVVGREEEAKASFRRQLEEILDNPSSERLLLSAEVVSNYSAKDLKVLGKKLSRRADSLRVIALVRSPLSSLESILQQQAYGGGTEDEVRELVGLVTKRYERLRSAFGERLEALDFHKLQAQTGGLVAGFFRSLGLPDETIGSLEFQRSNERISTEAYRLMTAINRKIPMVERDQADNPRRFHDLKPLNDLPGSPFCIEDFETTAWYAAAHRESVKLEQKYGFSFVAPQQREQRPLWESDTLLALEEALARLENADLRNAAVEQLVAEAEGLAESEPVKSSILQFVAQRAAQIEDPSTQNLLEQIGADYFKFAALQLGPESPKLALQLMSLAQKLRPGAPFIEERIAHYRKKLGLD